MKHLYLLLFTVFFTFQIHAQQAPFITTWEVTPGSLNITIPTYGIGFDYTIDFGDGTILTNQTGFVSHTYTAPGIYTVSITGDFPRLKFFPGSNYNNNAQKIKSIEQWGDIQWDSMNDAFWGCTNLVIDAIDAPDLSNVTDLSGMFKMASTVNQPINHWDVSNVVDMSYMFSEATLFNQQLNSWDVSNVTDMSAMFYGAILFNQSLNNWNVSNVTDMSSMFNEANGFNQSVNGWNVANVTDMSEMFLEAKSFDQPLNNWNVSNVTKMSQMFKGAASFNQPLSNWNVSNVTNMIGMFEEAADFNQPIDSWNLSNMANLSLMFLNATSFNQPLSTWLTSPFYGSIAGMFVGARSFNQDLSTWNFPNVSNFSDFVQNSGLDINNYELLLDRFVNLGLTNKSFSPYGLFFCDETSRDELINNRGWTIDGDLLYFNCSSIYPSNAFVTEWSTSPSSMSVTIPTIGIGYNYDVDFGDGTQQTNVTGNVTHTYSQHGSYTVVITGDFPRIYFDGHTGSPGNHRNINSILQWGTIEWQSMEKAFKGCSFLKILALDSPDLSQVTNMSSMFEMAGIAVKSIDNWDVSNVTNMSMLFRDFTINSSLKNWDVSNVIDMSWMFLGANFPTLELNYWDVSNVVNMKGMFSGSAIGENLDSWDVSSVTDMSGMFSGCRGFNHPINTWDVSNVTDMSSMFSASTSQTASPNIFNQPLDNWDVSNVVDMYSMFQNNSRFNQPLDSWDVSSVVNMYGMFRLARSFDRNIENWDVSNVTNMSNMFAGGLTNYHNYNKPLNNWDVSSVTDLSGMFQYTRYFDQPLDNWDVSNVDNMASMFSRARFFNQPLNNWDVSNVTSMRNMFRSARFFNQPLNNWDVSNVIFMPGMFNYASDFNQDISGWNFNPLVSLHTFISPVEVTFLNESGLDYLNYDALLARFAQLGLQDKKLGAQDLEYCNQVARDYLINVLGWEIIGDNISSDCKAIVGSFLYDQNNNGCDPNDIGVHGFMINANDGFYDFTTYSIDGTYHLAITGTSYTVSVVNAPSYFSVSPASANVTFSGTNTEVLDFCVTANQTIEDLNITLLPTSEARPGFDADYRLVVRNVGTETIANVEATLEFDDLMQQFVSSIPAPGTTTTNTLTFPIGSMQPFQTFEADITMLTFQPPTVNGDDILNFTAEVTPVANDHTSSDNTFNLAQVVVNSYDPNDKQVLQGEELYIDDIDEYLDYLIRFQNTGTASAINVRILDTLHPKLDWSTLTPISASHNYYVNITEGNRVEFMFDNIHLPDSLSNEPASHGFVAYKIKPKSNVQVGDVISGDAAIYFDFNAPIITNMVQTEIVEPLSVTDVLNPLNQVFLYPNPTNKTLHIHLTEGLELEEVLIYDLQGKEVQKIQGKETTVDVENLRPGMYLLKITTNQGTINRQLIKN